MVNADEPGQPTFESLCPQPTSFSDNPNPAFRRFTHSRPILDYGHGASFTRVPAFSGTTPIARPIGNPGAPAGSQFQGNCAIGGFYYTGNQFPATYKNTYFFSDHGENWIKAGSVDPEGKSLTYRWDFGDGTTSTIATPTHTFSSTSVSSFTVVLTVEDDINQVSLPQQVVISTNNTPPTVQITNPTAGTRYTMSQATSYTLAASVTDQPELRMVCYSPAQQPRPSRTRADRTHPNNAGVAGGV